MSLFRLASLVVVILIGHFNPVTIAQDSAIATNRRNLGGKKHPAPTPSPKYHKPPNPKPYHSSDSDDLDSCSDDYHGVGGDGQCCEKACGKCEEDDCKERAKKAGLKDDDCCPSRISDSGKYCEGIGYAPCIIDKSSSSSDDSSREPAKEKHYPTPSPKYYKHFNPKPYHSSDSDDSDSCSYDYHGVGGDGQCCEKACGKCEEDDCMERAKKAGLKEDDCCPSRISDSGKYCEGIGYAPCIVHKSKSSSSDDK